MRTGLKLRFKLNAMVLPLVAMVGLASGFFSFSQSQLALNRIANRHMTFKAEQLRDFAFSEWEVISKLGLEDKPEYRAAIEKSFRSYADSLLRNETELIAVFDDRGDAVMSVSRNARLDGAKASDGHVILPDGWFSRRLQGEQRVGVAFGFSPLGWTVAVSELKSAFFSELKNIQRAYVLSTAAALILLVVLLSVFLGYVLKPLERLSLAIRGITVTNDLTRRADVEYGDEIGLLAGDFNTMVSKLQKNYTSIETSNEAERKARLLAVDREEETLRILGRVSDFRDEETGRHLKRIGALSAYFSRLLEQDEDAQDILRKAAPLHDIGKIGIPDSILLKPGRLTPEEFEIIKRHSALGYELLKEAEGLYLREGAKIALSHHEKWDGSGYPRGLAGEAIPVSGRIVGIVDVFDALISKRSYKEAWPPEKARDYIAEQRGRQFDPNLVDLFVEHASEFQALADSFE